MHIYLKSCAKSNTIYKSPFQTVIWKSLSQYREFYLTQNNNKLFGGRGEEHNQIYYNILFPQPETVKEMTTVDP